MAEGYCVKCKAKKEISEGVEETMKNGRKAIKGKCPTCGTVMFKILGKSAAATPKCRFPHPQPAASQIAKAGALISGKLGHPSGRPGLTGRS